MNSGLVMSRQNYGFALSVPETGYAANLSLVLLGYRPVRSGPDVLASQY